MRHGLFDKDVDLLLVVTLLVLVLFVRVLSHSVFSFACFVWVVELVTSEFVLNTLDNNFCNLIEFVLSEIFIFFLHKHPQLVVFNMAREFAFLQLHGSFFVVVTLESV